MTAVRTQPAGAARQDRRPASRSRRPAAKIVRASSGRHLGPLPLGPLVVWQIVLAAALVGASRGGVWLGLGGAAVAVLAVSTLVRRRGRSLWRWFRLWRGFRRRRKQAAPTQHEPVLGPIREWLPEMELSAIDGRRGSMVGVVFDGSAYTIVLAPDAEELITSAHPDTVPLHALAEVGEVEGIRLSSAQLLVRTVAAPTPHLSAYAPQVGASYAEINPTSAPALTSWWVALRLEPSYAADSLHPEADGPETVPRALRKVLAWATKVLASSGLRCRALDQSEVREVLVLTTGVDPAVTPPARGARRTRETWTSWTADSSVHATGWVSRFPRRGLRTLSNAWSAMAALPVHAATASLVLAWLPSGEVECSAYVRVTTGERKATRQALGQLRRELGRARLGLVPLDGEQFLGVLATSPFGGGRS